MKFILSKLYVFSLCIQWDGGVEVWRCVVRLISHLSPDRSGFTSLHSWIC